LDLKNLFILRRITRAFYKAQLSVLARDPLLTEFDTKRNFFTCLGLSILRINPMSLYFSSYTAKNSQKFFVKSLHRCFEEENVLCKLLTRDF